MYHCQAEVCAVDLASLNPSCLCSENHRYFSHKIRKQEEEAETMASCFPLRTILFSGFILLVFLSYHLSNISVLPAISQEKRGEANLKKREDLESLNPLIYGTGQPSSGYSSPDHNKLPSSEWTLGRWVMLHCWSWECPEAVLLPSQWPLHSWGAWGWAMEQTCLSAALWTLFHVEIAGGQL